jgi:hypothetical protein
MNLRVSFVFVLSLLLCFAGRSAMAAAGPDLALQGGKVHPSPTANPIDDAVVLIRNGRIIAVAKRSELNIPKSALSRWDAQPCQDDVHDQGRKDHLFQSRHAAIAA